MEKTKRSIGGHESRLLDIDSAAACPLSASRPALTLRNIVPVGPFRPLARLLGLAEPFSQAAGHDVEPVPRIGWRWRFCSLGRSSPLSHELRFRRTRGRSRSHSLRLGPDRENGRRWNRPGRPRDWPGFTFTEQTHLEINPLNQFLAKLTMASTSRSSGGLSSLLMTATSTACLHRARRFARLMESFRLNTRSRILVSDRNLQEHLYKAADAVGHYGSGTPQATRKP